MTSTNTLTRQTRVLTARQRAVDQQRRSSPSNQTRGFTMSFDHANAVEWIERSTRDHPYCLACSAPTDVIDEDGVLVLRCTATVAPRGLLARLNAAVLPHDRVVLLDLREEIAA